MDRQKNSVGKSKSSNSAVTTKSDGRRNKTSKSNAEIQPLLLKKRGVYVEKKATKLSINPQNPNVPKTPVKKPPIPRPNRKRFLNSVLNILSKSTAGTQYPDGEMAPVNRRCERIKFKGKKSSEDNNDTTTTDPQITCKKKPKYRSKILNDHKNDLDQFVILQSKKEIVHTPSDNSQNLYKEPEVIKWSKFLPPLVKNTTKEERENSIYENANGGIFKEVLEGIKAKEKKVTVQEEPTINTKKDDKGLYNFFVDLLESTFSIYNVKTEYDRPLNSINSSKIDLEIDEAVARRLNFNKQDTSDNIAQKPSKHFCCFPENDWDKDRIESETRIGKPKCSPKSSKCSQKSSKKRIKTQSCHYARSKSPAPTTNSYIGGYTNYAHNKKTKKNPRKELLSSIKEQLKMDVDTFEEPQNLYQALKLIARNKRKYQKSIHFNDSTKTGSSENDPECVFKRRKVISFSTKPSSKKSRHKPDGDVFRSMVNNYSDKNSTIKCALKGDYTTDESEHSLEVFGFDYEPVTDKKPINRLNEIVLTYHSSPTQSEQDFNPNEALLKFSESGTSNAQNDLNWNRGIRSVSTVMKAV